MLATPFPEEFFGYKVGIQNCLGRLGPLGFVLASLGFQNVGLSRGPLEIALSTFVLSFENPFGEWLFFLFWILSVPVLKLDCVSPFSLSQS